MPHYPVRVYVLALCMAVLGYVLARAVRGPSVEWCGALVVAWATFAEWDRRQRKAAADAADTGA